MLNYIITNFNELLNLSDNNEFIKLFKLNNKISIIEIDNIDNINTNNNSFSNKLEKIYENINKKPIFKDVEVDSNLIKLLSRYKSVLKN